MAELSNSQVMISRAGSVIYAGDARLTAPLEGEIAYAPDEKIAEYAAQFGAPLVDEATGVLLDTEGLEDYALVDLNSGLAYSTQAGWRLADHPGDEVDLDDPQSAANYASSNSSGSPAAPSDWQQLQPAPFESVVSYPTS